MCTEEIVISYEYILPGPRHMTFNLWRDPPIPNDASTDYICAWWFSLSETQKPVFDAMAEDFQEISLYIKHYKLEDVIWIDTIDGREIHFSDIEKRHRHT